MTLALPTSREEAWRWSDLSGLEALAVAPATKSAPDADSHWISKGPRLLFVDGKLDASRSRIDGIAIGPTDTASSHALAKLATGPGWTLALPKDGASPPGGPIEIVHVATGGANHLPARIILAEDAQASIVNSFSLVSCRNADSDASMSFLASCSNTRANFSKRASCTSPSLSVLN